MKGRIHQLAESRGVLVVGSIVDVEDLLLATEPDELSSRMDIAEIRADSLQSLDQSALAEHIDRVAETAPVLYTPRLEVQGGRFEDDTARVARYEWAIKLGVSMVDVEAASKFAHGVAELAEASAVDSIASTHDFNGVAPHEQLMGAVEQAIATGATFAKVVATPQSEADYQRLRDLAISSHDRYGPRVIVMAMGAFALRSRQEFPYICAPLTYGSAGSVAAAPGQPLARALKQYHAQRSARLGL